MVEYIEWGPKRRIAVDDLKTFEFPPTATRILIKARPPVAKECSTD